MVINLTTIIRFKTIDIVKDQLNQINMYYDVNDPVDYEKKFPRPDLLEMIPFLFQNAHRTSSNAMSVVPDWIEYTDKYDDDVELSLINAFSSKSSVHKKDKNGVMTISIYNRLTGFSFIQDRKYFPIFMHNIKLREYLDNDDNVKKLPDNLKVSADIVKSFTLYQLNSSIYANLLLELIDPEHACKIKDRSNNNPNRKLSVIKGNPDFADEIERIMNDTTNPQLNAIKTNLKVKVANFVSYLAAKEELIREIGTGVIEY